MIRKNEDNQTIFDFITSNQVQAIITAAGLLGVIFNIYLVGKLAPLASSINTLEARANHTDQELIEFIPRSELEANFNPIKEDIRDIKQDIKDIKNSLVK